MSPYVIFRLPSGEMVKATPGSILGRLSSASVRIDDPRVSEAHALVSLRGSELKLLTLRGSLRVEGRRDADVVLEAGLRIHLARGVELKVVAVELPSSMTALQLRSQGKPFGEQVELTRSVYSILPQPEPQIVSRYTQNAPAHVWNTSDGWCIRLAGQERVQLFAAGRESEDGGLLGEVRCCRHHADGEPQLGAPGARAAAGRADRSGG